MEISKAIAQDIDLLLPFAEMTFRVAYEDQNDPVAFNDYCSLAFAPDNFIREMNAPASEFWLGKLNNELVAYLKLNFDTHAEGIEDGKTVQIERIYIHPDTQGRGLGRILLDFAEDSARQHHADWIWLSVWKKNPRGIKFYEDNGYEICGLEMFPLGDDPQEDWVMRKAIRLIN
ncbi:MAG: GNAT family N-acetyltransferase [Lewinellaceae bacterium]|nr:GNAT family N-acetyltransferase [Saprospiraceae bacterium]MCB9343630.1 GNAT family N-acetyltransferase [Lewinellaceae bacterium]